MLDAQHWEIVLRGNPTERRTKKKHDAEGWEITANDVDDDGCIWGAGGFAAAVVSFPAETDRERERACVWLVFRT